MRTHRRANKTLHLQDEHLQLIIKQFLSDNIYYEEKFKLISINQIQLIISCFMNKFKKDYKEIERKSDKLMRKLSTFKTY